MGGGDRGEAESELPKERPSDSDADMTLLINSLIRELSLKAAASNAGRLTGDQSNTTSVQNTFACVQVHNLSYLRT